MHVSYRRRTECKPLCFFTLGRTVKSKNQVSLTKFMKKIGNIPVIIGVGQCVDHWTGEDVSSAPHPVSIVKEAIEQAERDSGLKNLLPSIDCAAFIRTFSDSLRRPFDPFGKVKNFPHAVLNECGITPSKVIYSSAGGEQPQVLVAELCEKLTDGEIEVGLIAGGEVTGAVKAALKNRLKLDWAVEVVGDIDDRGAKTDFISDYEIKNGLGLPPQTYAAMDQALRARLGLSKQEYLQYFGQVYARLSAIAAQNPYAQFPAKRSAEFLASPSKENYPVFDPYLKWHIAQDAVNQAAALILTTTQKARELGVPEEKWVYVHGHAQVNDALVSKRPDLSRSEAIDFVIESAIQQANVKADDIKFRDIYSCFPIVLQIGAEALGLNPLKDELSITGGLSFFGGAGNNYSTHAIASMVEALRKERDAYGLVLANGGFMSKEAAGIYSCRAPETSNLDFDCSLQTKIDERVDVPLLEKNCTASIEAYCVKHGRQGPESGYIIARNENGRVIAKIKEGHKATLTALSVADDVVGTEVDIVHNNGQNFVQNPNHLGLPMTESIFARYFKYVSVSRDGNILLVTLNRPESYNALFSAAHFELAEIFDEFEADKDLWVAIITGSGDKAFCSGNDLKVTAKGGDMSTPSSGFAGLCSRTNREKPVIAAVNGVAMGGGLEIVLSCDIAIADPRATFALPEVKVGLFAAAGGVQRLTRQIGEKAAMELILTGRKIDATEASALGIVNTVSEPGNVLDEAWTLARTIAENSPTSIRASKRVLNQVDQMGDWDKALELSKKEIVSLLQTKDAREGVTAFAEKRKPKWVNG